MSVVGGWSCLTVALISVGWIAIAGTIAAWPIVRAVRLMKVAEQQHGIAAISGSIADLVWRFVVVVVPPLLLAVAWLSYR